MMPRPAGSTLFPYTTLFRSRRAAEWIIARQERDGSWGGIQPPWVYSLMALHLLGYSLDHPVVARGLAGLDRKSTRLNSSHMSISYAVFCLKKKKKRTLSKAP